MVKWAMQHAALLSLLVGSTGYAASYTPHYYMSAAWPSGIGEILHPMDNSDKPICRAILANLNRSGGAVSPAHWTDKLWRRPIELVKWNELPDSDAKANAQLFQDVSLISDAGLAEYQEIMSTERGRSSLKIYNGTEKDRTYAHRDFISGPSTVDIYAELNKQGHGVSLFLYKGGQKSSPTSFQLITEVNGIFSLEGRIYVWSTDRVNWDNGWQRLKHPQDQLNVAALEDREGGFKNLLSNPMLSRKVCSFPFH